MGIVKRNMEDDENLWSLATDILLRVGAIKMCEAHCCFYQANESMLQSAYKRGNFMVTQGNVICKRTTLSAAIKKAYGKMPEECSGCAHVMYDDD
jgi:hypothetical protein